MLKNNEEDYLITLTIEAENGLEELLNNSALEKQQNAINQAIKKLRNPRHPGLKAHVYKGLKGASGEKIFEAYAENKYARLRHTE